MLAEYTLLYKHQGLMQGQVPISCCQSTLQYTHISNHIMEQGLLLHFLINQSIDISVRPFTSLTYTWVHRCESHPSVGSKKLWPLIPLLHRPLTSWAILLETMASMSAKYTQFNDPLCHCFPAISSKSYVATN